MSRVFAYCRVSTNDQTTENQIREIAAAGFAVTPQRAVTETVSGSVEAAQRKGFAKLLDKMEAGDVLVVTKMDRLGRNAMDVRATVDRLTASGIRVHCLALGGMDLTSPAGKMTMGVINAMAEFERDLLIERTQAGLARAKAEGKTLGRPQSLKGGVIETVRARLAAGESVAAVARDHGTSRQTIMRIRDNLTAPA
ncbi:MAG TPA: resolvase [Hydrogenophaga sp.]|uniref:recombinase family protein n=1 Tax=Hydrogenophaga sp. TaxID=1904254 RepID=UPI0008B15DA0|nr:recombinase family protein [Hydrogenophaga sp.]OGA78143.1 MAG: resolvase [Burkholderiales bacterium GWE1_65_30]OGA94494.1 MAG: resolvase [Burkholderiales bacterium GWF1_66_17]HAX21609.1 resolvase [Hydrogenophaga sp.]